MQLTQALQRLSASYVHSHEIYIELINPDTHFGIGISDILSYPGAAYMPFFFKNDPPRATDLSLHIRQRSRERIL